MRAEVATRDTKDPGRAGEGPVLADELVARLVRGLGRNAKDDAYHAYRALYQRGRDALPAIAAYLQQQDWSKFVQPLQLAVFSTLVGLVRDIDEAGSDEIVRRFLSTSTHAFYRRRWESLRRFTTSGYFCQDVLGVRVFVSKRLRSPDRIFRCLQRWLGHLAQGDLAQVDRLYVIPKDDQDFLGHYTPVLYNVTLVWPEHHGIPAFLMRTLEIVNESTLYHEIGHHVHRHTWGQDSDQERVADAYARRILAQSHPGFALTARIVRRVLPRSLRRHPRKG